jgi:uncharacterized protein
MRRMVQLVAVLLLICGSSAMQAEAGLAPLAPVSGIPNCSPAAFLIIEQGSLAGVDWVEYHDNKVFTRSILMQSLVIDATIDLRADGTASHSSVILTDAGQAPQKPIARDLGKGSIYLSDMIVGSVEQAIARARVLNDPISHVLATSLYRDSTTDVLVERVDAVDWKVSFRNKTYQVLTDDHGCMLAATLPEFGIVVERRANFSQAQYRLSPPNAALPDSGYEVSEVKIPAPHGIVLAGTVTQPMANGPVPGAILITGLSPSERNGGMPPWMPLRDIADALTRAGYAVLRVDDRGIGASTGDHGPSTTYDEADDVQAEVNWLRSQTGIDPKRVVLVGYSEGGLIAAMIASKDAQIAAVVSLDGTGVPGMQLAREQIEQSVLHTSSIPAADRAKEVEKELAEPLTPRERVFLTIDPLLYAGQVHCPALILQGGSDITVPIRSAEKLATAIRSNGNSDVTVRIIPGVSHSLLPDPEGAGSGWVYLPAFQTSPEVLEILTRWLHARLDPTAIRSATR